MILKYISVLSVGLQKQLQVSLILIKYIPTAPALLFFSLNTSFTGRCALLKYEAVRVGTVYMYVLGTTEPGFGCQVALHPESGLADETYLMFKDRFSLKLYEELVLC